ncbi:MAG: hypothetical protein ACOWWM_08680 [Desulfobacterales bacterium]
MQKSVMISLSAVFFLIAVGCSSMGPRPDSRLQTLNALSVARFAGIPAKSLAGFNLLRDRRYMLQFEVVDSVTETGATDVAMVGERPENPNMTACLTVAIRF